MDLPQILANLEAHTQLADSLNELGTLLRQEDVRADSVAQKCVDAAFPLAPTEPLEVLRVLVNFCADNDTNRAHMVSNDIGVAEFWTWLFGQLHSASEPDVCARGIVLLGQFIHNMEEEAMAKAIGALLDKGAAEAALEYLHKTKDGEVMEFIAEFSAVRPEAVKTDQLDWIVSAAAKICLDQVDDGSDELHHASQAIFNATNVDNRDVGELIPSLYTLIQNTPQESENSVHIKRRLFSACGNISSYPSYDNWKDVFFNEELVKSTELDLYVVAAAAISLGNCVSSQETQKRLLSTIAVEQVVAAVLAAPFGDVVQYQAYHLFNNILTSETAAIVLNHPEPLFRATKVMVDNCTYYREIAAVYFKFLRKLIVAGEPHRVLLLKQVWDTVRECDDYGCNEAKLLLLQVVCAHPTEPVDVQLVRQLMRHSVAVQGKVEGTYVLQQIKTAAMVLHNYNADALGRFYADLDEFVLPLAQFLLQLQQAATGGAVENNTKFLAASALKFATGKTGAAWARLADVSRSILQ